MILIHLEKNALDSIAPMATDPHNITQSGQEPRNPWNTQVRRQGTSGTGTPHGARDPSCLVGYLMARWTPHVFVDTPCPWRGCGVVSKDLYEEDVCPNEC
jgi:hypothetical protein